jgi:hypothetical protein
MVKKKNRISFLRQKKKTETPKKAFFYHMHSTKREGIISCKFFTRMSNVNLNHSHRILWALLDQ